MDSSKRFAQHSQEAVRSLRFPLSEFQASEQTIDPGRVILGVGPVDEPGKGDRVTNMV